MAAPLALVGTAATIAGGVIGAQGAEKQGEANLIQNYYQSGVAQLNAQIAKQNADYVENVGEQQAQTEGMAGAQQLGQIVTAEASSGTDVNTGSNKEVVAGQKEVIGLNTAQIRANTAKSAYDYNVQASNFEAQSQLYQMAGTNAAEAGQITAESSILGTVGSVASKWTQGSQVGMLGPVGTTAGNIFSGISSTLGLNSMSAPLGA